MARITTNIPNLNIDILIDSTVLLKELTSANITGDKLTADAKDGLSDDKYNELAKQLRILYSISFDHVYSEDYEVFTSPNNVLSYSGHNERKNYLLDEKVSLNENSIHTSREIFKDVLGADTTVAKRTRFFNLAYVWTRAHELEELKLFTEAYIQYWRILDEMHTKGNHGKAVNALQSFGLKKTRSNIFAARVLSSFGREQRKSAKGEIADLAELDRLRQPHAHQAGSRKKYYLEEETHLEAKINNWLIADITKLFILWQLGLDQYFLNPRANIYEIKKFES